MDATLKLIGLIIFMLVCMVYHEEIKRLLGNIWLRVLIAARIPSGFCNWNDFANTEHFRSVRHTKAVEMLHQLEASDMMLAFARQHEGETHTHRVLIAWCDTRAYIYNLSSNKVEVSPEVMHTNHSSIVDALGDVCRTNTWVDPVWTARLVNFRVRHAIAYHHLHDVPLSA